MRRPSVVMRAGLHSSEVLNHLACGEGKWHVPLVRTPHVLSLACGIVLTFNAECGGQVLGGGQPPPLYGPCDLSKPFGQPVVLGGLQGRTPTLSPDELTIYFSSRGAILVAARAKRDEAFGPPSLVALSAPSPRDPNGFSSPDISSDGLTLVAEYGGGRLGESKRLSSADDFHDFSYLQGFTVDATYNKSVLSEDATALYLNQNTLVVRSQWTGAVWGPPQQLSLLPPLTGSDGGFAISHDELTLYLPGFDSPYQGAKDRIWVTHRPNTSSPFGPLTTVAELDASTWVPQWLSDDGCRLYLDNSNWAEAGAIALVRRGQ